MTLDRFQSELAFFLGAAVVGLLAWNFWPRPQPAVGVTVAAAPAPELQKHATIAVAAPKGVKTYPDKAKTDLNLPAHIIANPAARVVAASKVRADEHPHTVTTVIDTATGEASSFDRRDPLPWLAPDTHGEAALLYGWKNGQLAARLELSQNLLAVKALRLQARATLDQDGQWYAGAGVAWRW